MRIVNTILIRIIVDYSAFSLCILPTLANWSVNKKYPATSARYVEVCKWMQVKVK